MKQIMKRDISDIKDIKHTENMDNSRFKLNLKSGLKRVFMTLALSVVLVAAAAKNIIIEKEPLRLVIYDYSGAMSLYQKSSEKEEYVPLFSSANEACSSGFYLKYGKVGRKLTRSAGISIEVNEKANGAEVVYTVRNTAIVIVKYTILSALLPEVADCIRVDISVENLGKYSETFAVKGVFDTTLGEYSGNHFVTHAKPSLATELMFQSMIDDKWIRSSDGIESIQFLLDGGDISSPQYVAVANRDLLLSADWLPVVTDGRLFDSIRVAGNSALGIYWRDVQLKSHAKSNFTFYITTATSSLTPPDVKTVCANLSEELANMNQFSEPVYVDSHGTTFTVGELSDEQLDPEYISRLFERIQELEQQEETSSYYDEIQKLNAELDAILLKLGATVD